MKQNFILLGLGVLSAAVILEFAQLNQLKNDISELKETLQSKNEEKPANEILIVGNSILAGKNWSTLSTNFKVFNTSIPGITVYEANQYLPQLINRKAKFILLNLGINDALAGASGKMITYEYIKFITAVNQHSPESKLILISILPVSESILKETKKNNEITVVNTRMEIWCKNNHIPYMNIYPDFLKNGELNSDLTYDGIHLNEKGYALYEEKMKLYLKSIL